MDSLNIAIIEDNLVNIAWYKTFFEEITFPKCTPVYISDIKTFREKYHNSYFNLALVDFFLPDGNSMPIVQELKFTFPHCHVVMITTMTDMDEMSRLINLGIDGFIRKPVKQEELQSLLTTVFDQLSTSYQNVFNKKQITENHHLDSTQTNGRHGFNQIVYESPVMNTVMLKIQKIAPSESTVLIRGASGTGKELAARMIHSISPRKDSPFVELNIAALPESLLESELFGHKKGAFTGADSDRIGRFAEAEGGTLFIDEIGDIPPQIQAKLLRVIQFKQYQRVGDNQTHEANVRIIAATSRNLEEMIKTGLYREDLYYRLSVISILIPPLKERPGDIVPLINFFLEQKAAIHGVQNITLSDEALNILANYDYPGNVRELENAVEHGIVMSRGGVIHRQDLPDHLSGRSILSKNNILHKIQSSESNYEDAMRTFEINLLLNALKESNGNKSAAARSLGIGERKLRYRIQHLNINRPSLSDEKSTKSSD